ncbi:MAG: hypothetical protein Q9Q40_14695 [Acidobacteriota bacterium]|nr:hypothetical protein [Acidobacteriota bacterium]MDQ7086476.1 hypothetical protein [Acidobacteriota bacterium]
MREKILRLLLAATLILSQVGVLPALSGGMVLCIGSDGHRALEFAPWGLCCADASAAGEERTPPNAPPAPLMLGAPGPLACGPCNDLPPLREGRYTSTRKSDTVALFTPLVSGPLSLLPPNEAVLETPPPPAIGTALAALRTIVLRA